MTLVASGTTVAKMVAGGTTVQKVIVNAKMQGNAPLSINPSSYSIVYSKLLTTINIPVQITHAVGTVVADDSVVNYADVQRLTVTMNGNSSATVSLYIALTKGTYPISFTDSSGQKAIFTVHIT